VRLLTSGPPPRASGKDPTFAQSPAAARKPPPGRRFARSGVFETSRDATELCASHKFFLTLFDFSREIKFALELSVMRHPSVAPSRLPTFLLPCPFCGHRMAITAVRPAMYAIGAEGEQDTELEDVTHGCIQCGTTLTRTILPMAAAAHRDI
jgi:hypothetical protein